MRDLGSSCESCAFAPRACEQITGQAFLREELPGGVVMAPVYGLKKLELPDCDGLETRSVEWIAAGCTGLHALGVSHCKAVTSEGIERLVASPTPLTGLRIAGCAGVGDAALGFVADYARGLQHLDISDISRTAAGVVGKILRNCKYLQTIDMSGLNLVDGSSFIGLMSSCDPKRPQPRDNPHEDGESWEVQRSIGGNMKGPARTMLSEGLPHLLVARMLRLPGMDDASVMAFARACPRLQELLISDSPMVTGACLESLSSFCPMLRSLGLDRCRAASDESALVGALRNFPDLEHLRLAREGYGEAATASGHRAEATRSSKSCTSCSRAPFGGGEGIGHGVDVASPGESFKGEALAAASRFCSRLISFGLEGHRSLVFGTENAPPGAFPCMRELRLTSCDRVNDEGLQVLLRACPLVRTLLLYGTAVSKDALAAAARSRSFVEIIPPPPVPIAGFAHAHASFTSEASSYGHSTCNPPLPPDAPRHMGENSDGSRAPGDSKSSVSSSSVFPDFHDSKHIKRSTGTRVTGLRPAPHAAFHLSSEALATRLERERTAYKTLLSALSRFKRQRLRRRLIAAERIQRALRRHHFRITKAHPDQVELPFCLVADVVGLAFARRFRRVYLGPDLRKFPNEWKSRGESRGKASKDAWVLGDARAWA